MDEVGRTDEIVSGIRRRTKQFDIDIMPFGKVEGKDSTFSLLRKNQNQSEIHHQKPRKGIGVFGFHNFLFVHSFHVTL